MYRISFLYAGTPGCRFDHAYYLQRHMPLVMARLGALGLLRFEVDRGVGGAEAGSPAPFIAAAHLYYDSLIDYRAGMERHGPELLGDVPNYTNLRPLVQISEIA